MSFIPEEELKSKTTLNLAPMIDFLFLMLMFFATLAVSRNTTRDTDIDLVEVKPEAAPAAIARGSDYHVIHLSINEEGQYKWLTEWRDHPMDSPEAIREELANQYEKGLLPEDKSLTQVMLRIDKNAKWDPILKAVFAVRDAGYEIHPVYAPEETPSPLAGK